MEAVVAFGLPAHQFEHQLGSIGLGGNNGIGAGSLKGGHACSEARRFLAIARTTQQQDAIEQPDSEQQQDQQQRTSTNAHRSSVEGRTA